MKHLFSVGSLLVVAVACSHTTEVETGATADRSERPRTPAARPTPAARSADGDGTPLASDPMEMLTPEGRKRLREQLERRDLLKSGTVPAALRKFQAAEGMPETGMPDDETLRRLGLDPDDVVVRVRPPT
jgi:hypothetical protein